MKWNLIVVKPGLSGDGKFYPPGVLKRAVEKFNGAWVQDAHGMPIGNIKKTLYAEYRDGPAVVAEIDVSEPASAAMKKVMESKEQMGVKIDFTGETVTTVKKGHTIKEILSIDKVHAIILVPPIAREVRVVPLHLKPWWNRVLSLPELFLNHYAQLRKSGTKAGAAAVAAWSMALLSIKGTKS